MHNVYDHKTKIRRKCFARFSAYIACSSCKSHQFDSIDITNAVNLKYSKELEFSEEAKMFVIKLECQVINANLTKFVFIDEKLFPYEFAIETKLNLKLTEKFTGIYLKCNITKNKNVNQNLNIKK